MSLNRGQSLSKLLNRAAAVFMHRPFHKMPMNAFSISYLYALANGDEDDYQEFYDLLAQANIQPDEIKKELKERPDLVTFLQTDINKELFPKTNKALKSLNRIKPFEDKVLSKIKLGNELTKEMGNIYSGSIFAWLAAGIEDSMKNGKDLSGKDGLLIGYGSGDAAEVIPISFTQDCCDKESNIKYSSAFSEPVNLNHKQYIKLRTNKILEGVESRKSKGFVVSKVGKEESTDFQDAGIEYYEYLN